MLQPFEPFRPEFVDRLLRLNKKFLVTQTYPAGADTCEADIAQKIPLLVSDYEQLSRAKTHCNAVRPGDRYAAIIRLEVPEHVQKLHEMLAPGSGYRLYFAVIKSREELQRRLDRDCREHMRRWIDRHTTWRIKKDAVITPSLQLIFGILYIELKYAGQTVRITFEELQNT
jgi:hypothetical protein